MLIDSFDKKNYAPTRTLEARMDSGQRSFKSILQKNSAIENNKSILQINAERRRDANRASDELNSTPQKTNGDSQKIRIGTLSDDTPTVSELLYRTQYKKNCWEVLEKDVNSSKHFKRIPDGTDIYIDKATSEIVWEKDHGKNNLKRVRNLETDAGSVKSYVDRHDLFENTSAPSIYKSRPTLYEATSVNYKSDPAFYKSKALPYKSETDTLYRSKSSHHKSETQNKQALNEAVQEFMGKDYSKIDCYELVVNGLQNMGVKYLGKDGLGKYLIDKAIDEGLSQNHYLTGEGLVAATGHSVYNKRVINVKSPDSQAQSAMQEMEKVLKEGQILSFSTQSRGHTGVISRKNGVWTFINSGYMDNNIAGKNGKKQVGEEILSKELENWFNLAGKKKEGLQITLGDIELSKLAAYREDKSKVSERV